MKTTIGRLADKGFAWRLLNQDKIKEELAAAETAISDALTIFNVSQQYFADNVVLLSDSRLVRDALECTKPPS